MMPFCNLNRFAALANYY